MVLRILTAVAAALAISNASGRGVSPYLPLNLSPEIERQIERVLILADRPIMTRPIAAATVLDALPAACERDPAACTEVQQYLSSYMKSAALTHASITLGADSGAEVALPNRHGMRSTSDYEVSALGYWQPSDYLLVNGGVLAYEGETTPTGTMLSAGFEYAQIDLGYRDHWLSPVADSAMLISTQAQTMFSATISNYTPLTKWNLVYELFLAEMSTSDRIRYAGGLTSGHPRLAGMHVSIQPLPGWSIGFNRIMQFGGGARGGNSFGDIVDAFFNPSKADNTSSPNEFGNQAASITSRFMIPSKTPFSVYFEYAGEDTSTNSNFRLGNAALSGGIHFPTLWRGFELRIELSEWQNGWYVHHIYLDGLRNEGNVIGHWGADWRELNDGVGASSVMARLGWQPKFGGWLETTLRTLDNESYSDVSYERANSFELFYSRTWREFRIGAELQVGNDVFGDAYSRIGGFIRY